MTREWREQSQVRIHMRSQLCDSLIEQAETREAAFGNTQFLEINKATPFSSSCPHVGCLNTIPLSLYQLPSFRDFCVFLQLLYERLIRACSFFQHACPFSFVLRKNRSDLGASYFLSSVGSST